MAHSTKNGTCGQKPQWGAVVVEELSGKIAAVKRGALKASISVLIGVIIASSITVIPLLPFGQSIFLAGVLSVAFIITSVKRPKLMAALCAIAALGLMFYQMAYLGFFDALYNMGMLAQTGAIVWSLGMLLSVLFILDTPYKALSALIGLLALFLMFTPGYYLAIPAILVSFLASPKFNPWLSVFYYMSTYLPFQIISFSMEKAEQLVSEGFMELAPAIYAKVTIYEHVNPPLSALTLDDLTKAFSLHAGGISAQAIINSMLVYINSSIAFAAFLLFIVASFAVAKLALKSTVFFASFKSICRYAETAAKGSAMLFSIALFHTLTTSLSSPLNYVADLNDLTLTYSMLFAVVAGFSVLFSNLGLSVIESQESFKESLRELLSSIERECEKLTSVVKDIKGVLPATEVSPVERKALLLLDKVKSTRSRLKLTGILKLKSISQAAEGIKAELDEVKGTLNASLTSTYIRRAMDFNEVAEWAESIGLKTPPPEGVVLKVSEEEVSSWSEEKKVFSLTSLNKAAGDLANKLLELYDQVYKVVRDMVDPSLPSINTGYSIVKAYIDQGDVWLALREVKEHLSGFERRYSGRLRDLRERVLELLRNFEVKFAESQLAPLMNMLGREAFKEELKLLEAVSSIKDSLTTTGEISEIVKMNVVLNELYNKSVELLNKIYEKVRWAEEVVDEKTPVSGYDWGKDAEFYNNVQEFLNGASYNPFKAQSILDSCKQALLELAPRGLMVLRKYFAMRELMSNYPIAEYVIMSELSKKGSVMLSELPFSSEYGREYMRLFFTRHFSEYSLDTRNWTLKRRAGNGGRA